MSSTDQEEAREKAYQRRARLAAPVFIPALWRVLDARRKDAAGALLGEQTLRAGLRGDGRYVLKIEMDGEQSVPRFSLTAVRGR